MNAKVEWLGPDSGRVGVSWARPLLPSGSAAITETKDGVRYLKVDAAKALLLIWGNWYLSPSLLSIRVVNNQAVISQGLDPEADAFMYTAGPMNTSSTSVTKQIQAALSANPNVVVIVNKSAVADLLNGNAYSQFFIFAKNINKAKALVSAQNVSNEMAILPPEATSALFKSGRYSPYSNQPVKSFFALRGVEWLGALDACSQSCQQKFASDPLGMLACFAQCNLHTAPPGGVTIPQGWTLPAGWMLPAGLQIPAGMTLPWPIPGLPAAPTGIPLPLSITLPIDWALPLPWTLTTPLSLPAGTPLPMPPEFLFARGLLVAWSKTDGQAKPGCTLVCSPFADYGTNTADFHPAWTTRDMGVLKTFREWWNGTGSKPAASLNTAGTYPTSADIAALTAWGQKKATPPAGWFPPPVVPPALPPAMTNCAQNCLSKPDPVAYATCLADCLGGGGGAQPGGGGGAQPGGGGGGTPTTCPEGYILSAGVCQPKLPAPPTGTTPSSGGASSGVGWLVAGAVVLAAVGIFAATAGMAPAISAGKDNPRRRKIDVWFRAGDVERGANYEWRTGYSRLSSGMMEYPWLTKREAQSRSKHDGAMAMFFDTREEAEAFLRR